MNPNFVKSTMKFYTQQMNNNRLRENIPYMCRNMIVTHLNLFYAWIIEIERVQAYLARENQTLSWRCYRCEMMILTAPLDLKDCVEMPGMD